jgi:hypothetical protein
MIRTSGGRSLFLREYGAVFLTNPISDAENPEPVGK